MAQKKQNEPEAKIVDGKALAEKLRASIAHHVSVLVEDHKIMPGLAVVLVGDDPASEVYVASKKKMAEKAGMRSFVHILPKSTSQDEVLKLVRSLNAQRKVHGILVQLPLPKQIDADTVLKEIDPAKDVDGLTITNMGRLMAGLPGLVPCTPLGCVMLVKEVERNLTGLHAVVIGRSSLVGKPVAQLLLRENCTVTMCHSRTRNLPHIARQADILVAAVGRSGFVKGDWIKPGAIVIDVGINRGEDGKLSGDVDFEEASKVAGYITPVPGGVGPMTVACLLGNTLIAACRQNELTVPHLG
ncbi:MAG: bifunctional methylenetetrahydrofolate dehydrogenase/methenyltetrahydrofolate cyclohydrolase FolD [Alphaproteobacteria bacterium]|nr:bifunctional methylenetetrahydrofolate dehydrogenase/methenyltetrahydrofolate cyclohydrolase FolD [Alphaproteobacteria bacterium]